MKNLLKILVLVALTTTITSSCKKENIEPKKTTVKQETGIRLWGEFKLLSGKMYMENMETHQKVVYNHFDSTKKISSLRYSGAIYNIEIIEENITTWTFTPKKEFWHNNDSLHPYGLSIIGDHWSIIEHPTATIQTMQLGGSARPFFAVVEDYTNNIIQIQIQDAVEGINGYNYEYYSILRFQKIKEL